MKFQPQILALAAAACFASTAQADIVTLPIDTSSGQIFNRLLEDLSALSTTGTATRFSAFSFTVNQTGSYSFVSTAAFDNFTFLYSGIFNRLQPTVGALKANDDLMSTTTSGFTFNLTAGSIYTFVTTGFENADFGRATNTIGGPGLISAVPEPSIWLSLALGMGVVSVTARRRNKA